MGPIHANSLKYQARMGYSAACTTMETLMNWISFPYQRSRHEYGMARWVTGMSSMSEATAVKESWKPTSSR